MSADKTQPVVSVHLYEIAVIIVETSSGRARPDGYEAAELMDALRRDPITNHTAVSALIAAQRIGDYIRTAYETTIAMQNIGAL